MLVRFSVFVTLALVAAPIAHADKLYKWVDKDGHVSYHDQPPYEAGYRVEEKHLHGVGSDNDSEGAAQKAPVVLYSAPKCSSCDAARAYLRGRGIPFTEKNVEGDRKLQDELIKQAGGLAVPTIMVGSKVMRGFLESLLDGELDQAGYPKASSGETPQEESPNS
jgi:glutaredoxin